MAALAKRGAFDERLGRALGRPELGAAEREARIRDRLERLQRDLLEAPARLIEPRRLVAGQEPAVIERDEVTRRDEDRAPVRALLRIQHVCEPPLGVLYVDLRLGAQRHRRIADGDEHPGAERPPEPRQHDGEPLGVRRRRVRAPERADEAFARDGLRALQRDVGEREPPPGALGVRTPARVRQPKPRADHRARS